MGDPESGCKEIPRICIPRCLTVLSEVEYRVTNPVCLRRFAPKEAGDAGWVLLPAGAILDIGARVGRVLGVHIKNLNPGPRSETLEHLRVGEVGAECEKNCRRFFEAVELKT